MPARPGSHRTRRRLARRAATAGWCWWRATCPPSTSTTRWSSWAPPRASLWPCTVRNTKKKEKNVHIVLKSYCLFPFLLFRTSFLPLRLCPWRLKQKKKLSPWVNERISLGCWKLCQKSSDRSSFIGSDINSPGLTEIIKAALLHLTWEPLLSIPSLINGRAVAAVVNKESSISLRRVSNYCSIGI